MLRSLAFIRILERSRNVEVIFRPKVCPIISSVHTILKLPNIPEPSTRYWSEKPNLKSFYLWRHFVFTLKYKTMAVDLLLVIELGLLSTVIYCTCKFEFTNLRNAVDLPVQLN